MNLTPLLHHQSSHPPNSAIFMSGTGANAEKILRKYAKNTVSPFHISCIVTDRPKSSRASALAEQFNIPLISHGLKDFYAQNGLLSTSLATSKGQEMRERWTDALRTQLARHHIDFGIFAGFIPLTNITADFPCLNVHPGDLTVETDGQRLLVGLHALPIEIAILSGHRHLRSSVVLPKTYAGSGDGMDDGHILGISPEVPIDLRGECLTDLQQIAQSRPSRRPRGGYGDQLEAIANHNLDLLKYHGDLVVFPQVIDAFARGHYLQDDTGTLHYQPAPGETPTPIYSLTFSDSDITPLPITLSS